MSKKRAREERERLQEEVAAVGTAGASSGKRYKGGAEEAALIKSNRFKELTVQEASRLIYPNPVCFLTSITPASKLNVMTLSWLAPANNYGGFVFVIHKTRYSASCLLEQKEFMLSVASAAQIDLLLECGKTSGSSMDKLNGSVPGLMIARPIAGEKSQTGNAFSALQDSSSDDDSEDDDNKESNALALKVEDAELAPIAGSVANIKCRVLSHSDAADAGHWLVVAQIEEAKVHPQYWDGKTFGPTDVSLPPLLSFLGSQRFGAIRNIDHVPSAAVAVNKSSSASTKSPSRWTAEDEEEEFDN